MYEDEYVGAEYQDVSCDLRTYRGDTLVFFVQAWAPAQPQPTEMHERQVLQVSPSASPLGMQVPSRIPQNLTGWFLQFTAKKQTADGDNQAVAVSKTTGVAPNVITFPNGAVAGLTKVSVGPLSTAGLGDGDVRLVYDLIGIDPSGTRTVLRHGRWTVTPTASNTTVPD
jgi:hypothetical protein